MMQSGEIERLRAENERLRAALGMTVQMPEGLSFTPSEWRILCALLKRDRVPTESLHAIMSDRIEHAYTDPRWVSAMIYKLRNKLRQFGIAIHTQYGFGYYLTPENKAKLRPLLAEAPQ